MQKTLRPLLWPALALPFLLAWDASGADLNVMRWVGDSSGFAAREAWVASRLIHDGGRWLSDAVMVFLLLVNLSPRLLPALTVRERRWWLGSALACLALVAAIKHFSKTSCPWDLTEFGGTAAYVSHWAWGVKGGGGGHCFPSGHASAAFAYLAGGWALARAYPAAARGWWAAVVVLGVVYGLGQMARGAHYPSHTMWTAWLCWALTVALLPLLRRVSKA